MKFDIIENKENEDGSFSFEVDYDREFKKHFEKTYNKRLTKKSLTSGLVDGLWWTAAEVLEKPPGSAGARRPAPARGVAPDMAEHAAEEKDLRRQQLEAREKLGGDARGPLLSRRR